MPAQHDHFRCFPEWILSIFARLQNRSARPSRRAQRAGWDVGQHLGTLTKPGLLRRWYRQTFPLPTYFFDGRPRLTRRSVYRLFKLWLKAQGSNNEAWAAYDAYRGGDVIDIGASNGFFSLLLGPKARAGTRQLCLEPDTRDFPKLLEHLAEAKRLFREVDFVALPQAAGNGRENVIQTATGAKTLPTSSVDGLVEFFHLEPDFIKIDVEGFEWTVLEGMEQTLRRFAPVIHLEIHPTMLPATTSSEQIQQWLAGLGYKSTPVDATEYSLRQLWHKS